MARPMMNPHCLPTQAIYLISGFLLAMLIEVACPGLRPVPAWAAQVTHPRAHLTVYGVLTRVEIIEEMASPGLITVPIMRVRVLYEVGALRVEAEPRSDLEKFLTAKLGAKVAILIGPAE